MGYDIVSHHLLRRRARALVRELNEGNPGRRYATLRATRGPWRWYVVRTR